MANIIKRVTFSDDDNKLSSQGTFWPNNQTRHSSKCNPNVPEESQENEFYLTCPYRARFLEIIHPGLRQLRAAKLPPKEREVLRKDLLELLLYWAESAF